MTIIWDNVTAPHGGVPTSEIGYNPAMPRRERTTKSTRTCGGIGEGVEVKVLRLHENGTGWW